MPLEPCHRVRSRVAHDKKRGYTTSDKTVDVIRRMCDCEFCDVRRKSAQAMKETR